MPNKWLIVNGLKYPAEENMVNNEPDVEESQKKPSISEETKSFTWFGKGYEEVCEISLEEALEFQRWVKENKNL